MNLKNQRFYKFLVLYLWITAPILFFDGAGWVYHKIQLHQWLNGEKYYNLRFTVEVPIPQVGGPKVERLNPDWAMNYGLFSRDEKDIWVGECAVAADLIDMTSSYFLLTPYWSKKKPALYENGIDIQISDYLSFAETLLEPPFTHRLNLEACQNEPEFQCLLDIIRYAEIRKNQAREQRRNQFFKD